MSWLEGLYVALSISVGVGVFFVLDEDTLVDRALVSSAWALLWLPALILFALMMAVDGIVWLLRWVRG